MTRETITSEVSRDADNTTDLTEEGSDFTHSHRGEEGSTTKGKYYHSKESSDSGIGPELLLPGFSLLDRFIDEPRTLNVAVIGGGLAGILAGILLPRKVPGLNLTIFEKNKDFVSIPIYIYRRHLED